MINSDKNQLSLEKIKEIELGIMEYIDAICTENHLTYYLAYGSLLGAIRHRGFIPWDDDIDIVMSRSDMNKLLDIVKSMNHERFGALIPLENGYNYEFAKIYDKRTTIHQLYVDDIEQGIWVDIFPLDGLKKDDKLQNLQLKIYQRCRVASIYRNCPPCSFIMKPFVWCFWKFTRMIGWEYFLGKIEQISKKYTVDECKHVGFAPSIHSKNKYIPKEWFGNGVMVDFEDRKFVAPVEWDNYLKSLYGDYMKLPPENQRVPHKVIAFWK